MQMLLVALRVFYVTRMHNYSALSHAYAAYIKLIDWQARLRIY